MIWGVLRHCGPLSLLLASVLVIPAVLAIDDLAEATVAMAVMAVTLLVMVGGDRLPLWRLVPVLIGFVSVTWSNWLLAADRSVANALVSGLRVAFFVLPGVVLASYLDPSTLGDHLGQRLRLPARPVLALSAALQRAESLEADWEDLARVRRARGLGPRHGPVSRVRYLSSMTFALLVHAIRQAGRMTVAMEARGYSAGVSGGPRRTWAEPAPWTRADTLLILVAAALAAVPVLR
ncbi:MAG TPA: energy-coupling factor transporter transmembrane component T [Dermatophilaceae bacterium]|nr:energy-coupling factor transporter transmembrane component T [Dermatophilaceae bacterium]